jgi:predicted nuclease with RNAse H fold
MISTGIDREPSGISGAVLGIDVGFSSKRQTTGMCLLFWDHSSISMEFDKVGVDEHQRLRTILKLVSGQPLSAVAVDGPLTHGLKLINRYRSAEAILSRGVLQRRGKPGPTNSPTGQELHRQATDLAHMVLRQTHVAEATHHQAIHEKRIVEAFPNMFLAALVREDLIPLLRRDASDKYWEVLVGKHDDLEHYTYRLLPKRSLRKPLRSCCDHEHRASLICSLTALTVAVGQHIGVGDPKDGDIILPSPAFWGGSPNRPGRSWMAEALRNNITSVQMNRSRYLNHDRARAIDDDTTWTP